MHTYPSRFTHLLLLIVIISGLLFAPAQAGRAAPSGVLTPAEFDCAAAGLPLSECQALLAIYNATNGPGWAPPAGVSGDNWLTTNTPCTWKGLTCTGGHVTGLALRGFGLSGALPPELGSLASLQALDLWNNLITDVPYEFASLTALRNVELGGNRLSSLLPGIGNPLAGLVNLETFGVHYNLLQIYDTQLSYLLDAMNANPNWRFTQTVPPTEFRITAVYTDGLQVSWTPILYTTDGGGYEIGYADNLDGPYTVLTETANKSASSIDLHGLPAGAMYLNVRSHSAVHLEPSAPSILAQFRSDYAISPIPLFNCANVSEIPQSECVALAAFYTATNGPWGPPFWIEGDAWLTTHTPCTWDGITCRDGDVTGISLNGFSLSGSLPAEIGDLAYLNTLNLGYYYETVMGGGAYYTSHITALPPEIGSLVNLQTLDLSGNPLSSLPDEIWQLTNLQTLLLAGTPQGQGLLTSLSPAVSELVNLQVLNLDYNQLASLPDQLWSMTSLQSLSIGNNQLTSLPSGIGNLINLNTLGAPGNLLTSLPVEIGSLVNLQDLNLGANHLTSLLPEIDNLAVLERLNLNNNQLTSLPAEIGGLANLNRLNLDNNQLTSLPAETSSLINLGELTLSNNQLESLPSGFANMKALWYLDLNDNHLASLPDNFSEMSSMHWLHLQGNRLASLPSGMHTFTNLSELYLAYNCVQVDDPLLLAFMRERPWMLDWQYSQTIPPSDLRSTAVYSGGVELSWTPITYTADGGGYEISYAGDPGGPFTVLGFTEDKSASSFLADGLPESAAYYFRVRTHTPPHNFNANDLWSGYTAPISVTILDASQPVSVTLQPEAAANLALRTPQGQFISLALPAGAVTETTTLEFSQPLTVTPLISYTLLGAAFDLSAYRNGQPLADFAFQGPVNLSVSYDGATGLHEATLSLYTWDGGAWVEAACGDYQRSAWGNWLSAPVCHLSRFAVFGQPPAAVVYLPVVSR